MKPIRAVLWILSFLICAPACAETIVLQQGLNGSTTDTRIASAFPTTNYGADPTYALLAETSISLLIRFPIFAAEGGPVPNGATITSATLSLYKYWGPDAVFKASRLLKDWNEAQATWNQATAGTAWETAGARGASDVNSTADGQGAVPTTLNVWMDINVTAGVQAFASGTPNYGWKVAYVSGSNISSAKEFISRDSTPANAAFRPKLTITYTDTVACGSGSLRPYNGSPVNGTAIAVPSTFEAEHFNCGGAGVAYNDVTTPPGPNSGQTFRATEGVQITSGSGGGGLAVNQFDATEWMVYSINVPATGAYDIAILASASASGGGPGAYRVAVDGVDVPGDVTVPLTASWDDYQWVTKSGVNLTAGVRQLRITSVTPAFRVDKIRVTAGPVACGGGGLRPYSGTPVSGIPIDIASTGATAFEAEHFNCGGAGVAYNDVTSPAGPNAGQTFRQDEGVQIIAAPSGLAVNQFDTGEWMIYTINVLADGTYDLAINASSNNPTAGKYKIEIDGNPVTGDVTVPITGNWETYQWVTGATGVALTAGQHQLKLSSVLQSFRIDQVRLTATGTGGGGGGNPQGLIFRSGFEGGTTLNPTTPANYCYDNRGCWQYIRGTDSTTGFSWPPNFSGADSKFQMLVAPQPATTLTMNNVANWMHNTIVDGQGRNGSRGLYMEISQKGSGGTGPQGGEPTQDTLHLWPTTEVPTLYVSYWLKLQPDLLAKLQAGGTNMFFQIFNLKTVDTDFRYTIYVFNDASGQLYWQVRADTYYNCPGACPAWSGSYVSRHDVAVPLDRWFKVEVFWKRSNGPDGRWWAAVDGVMLTDHSGPNMGPDPNPDRIDRIMVPNLYTGGGYPIKFWVDDLQVWDRFPPPGTTADSWYDPPYATHTP